MGRASFSHSGSIRHHEPFPLDGGRAGLGVLAMR
jgi:hypothetical protein